VTQAETQMASAKAAVTARHARDLPVAAGAGAEDAASTGHLGGVRLSGQEALAVRASKKLRSDELLLTSFASTRLRMELDRVPLWRSNHVAVKQLVEDFARYLYLPRLKDSTVLLHAIGDGMTLLTWEQDSFAFADSFDAAAGRYKGLRGGQMVMLSDPHMPGLLVKPEVAAKQLNAERTVPPVARPEPPGGDTETTSHPPHVTPSDDPQPVAAKAKRFHGAVTLDTARVGRDASRIAEEVIAHLSGLVGATVTVTLEIAAAIPAGVPDHVVRTVTENSRTLKFTSQGFEKE
jgi:hypothetical protein